MPDTETIQTIPLSKLRPAAANVRRARATETEQAELIASIEHHGLLNNLVVAPLGKTTYAVVAGERRRQALTALAEAGTIAKNHPVPCVVRADGGGELSLAENTARAAMHPLDALEAFAALADGGASPSAIADRFGVSEATVHRRLRLGRAHESIRAAFRDGDLTLAELTAFAVVADVKRQLAVWNDIKGGHVNATHIRRLLTEGKIPADAALARFVGVETYAAAGGTTTRDLFSSGDDGVFLDDGGLVRDLARAELDKTAAAIGEAEGWKWSQVHLDAPHEFLWTCGRVHPTRREPSEEQERQLADLEAVLDALSAIETERPLDDDETSRQRAAEEAVEAIGEALVVFEPEQRAEAGFVAYVDFDGALRVVKGLIHPDDKDAEAAAAKMGDILDQRLAKNKNHKKE